MAVMEATSPQPMTFMLQHSATGVKTQPGRQREKRSCVQAAGVHPWSAATTVPATAKTPVPK